MIGLTCVAACNSIVCPRMLSSRSEETNTHTWISCVASPDAVMYLVSVYYCCPRLSLHCLHRDLQVPLVR